MVLQVEYPSFGSPETKMLQNLKLVHANVVAPVESPTLLLLWWTAGKSRCTELLCSLSPGVHGGREGSTEELVSGCGCHATYPLCTCRCAETQTLPMVAFPTGPGQPGAQTLLDEGSHQMGMFSELTSLARESNPAVMGEGLRDLAPCPAA